ncbi:MAG: hypothetical protein ABSE92_06955 [Terriglobales bacterium]
MNSSRLRIILPAFALVAGAVLLLTTINAKPIHASTYPVLACGTDASGFSGENGQLAVVQTNGPNTVGSVQVFDLDFPLNGLTPARGYVMSGQPEAVGSSVGNTLRALGEFPPPHIVKTILPGDDSFSPDCCEEQMVMAPDGSFYHAHYSDVIQKLALQSGESEVLQTYNQPDIVGMASDGKQIWISNWDGKEVGTWDPTTNVFTPVFSTPDNAGALAWDVTNGVLWVGMEGGAVIPFSATGQQLGSGFQPFGAISGTVDGLAFVPSQFVESLTGRKQ